MFHLRITSVSTASALRSAANADALREAGYTVEDGYVIVESQAEADALLSGHSNLELDLQAGAERNGEIERVTMTGDGVERSDDYPTTDDGEPLCVGMDDGQCSRVVDDPGGRCWQHD